jgi:DNA-directed RNA polymerase subunit beta'
MIKTKDYNNLYSGIDTYFTESSKGKLVLIINDVSVKGDITFYSGDHYLGKGLDSLELIFSMIDRDKLIPHSFFKDKVNLFNNLLDNPLISICRVIPIHYREIYKVGEMFIVDNINLAYKSILSSTYRIKHYLDHDENYLDNPRYWYEVNRITQELSVLMEGKSSLEFKKTPIKNYPKILNRKHGLIRGSLLGKRSSFSGRSVNSSVESSKINISNNEIIVPFYLAKNILRLHIIRELGQLGFNYENANNMIDNEDNEVLNILEKMDNKYNVYLSRAPALYKYSFMGFRMRINFNPDDRTIKVHPLQNTMFNLDYDKI